MKRFFKVLLAAWLTGLVLGGGCFCGAVGAGLLVPKAHSDDYAMVQCQIADLRAAVDELSVPMPQGFDEMEGVEP